MWCYKISNSLHWIPFYQTLLTRWYPNIKQAVESKRRGFDSLHNTITGSLALCEDAPVMQFARTSVVETALSRILDAIQAAREQMVAENTVKNKGFMPSKLSIDTELNRDVMSSCLAIHPRDLHLKRNKTQHKLAPNCGTGPAFIPKNLTRRISPSALSTRTLQ